MDDRLQRVVEAERKGDFDLAERLCYQLMDSKHGSSEAYEAMGRILVRRRLPEAAALQFEQALDLKPDSFAAIQNLSMLYLQLGRVEEAVEMCRRAVVLARGLAEAHHALGSSLMEAGRYEEARSSFNAAQRLKPDAATIHYRLALTEQLDGNPETAIEEYRRGVGKDPAGVSGLNAFAKLQSRISKPAYADLVCQALLQIEPDLATVHETCAAIAWERGSYEESAKHLDRALELDPANPNLHRTRGVQQQEQGHFENANSSFRRAIQLEPNQGSSYLSLLLSEKVTDPNSPLLAQMLEVATAEGLASDERYPLHLAIGRAYEDLGDFETSMVHYDSANAYLLDRLKREKPFHPSNYRAATDSAINRFSKQIIKEAPADRNLDDLPIVVVGMIRSGTTLTEQILSCHPRVGGAGELVFWANRISACLEGDSSGLNWPEVQRAASDYCARLRQECPDKDRVVDKLPGNFLYAGLIHAALPNTRIVHVHRDPRDTCLSIWTTRIGTPMDFMGSRANIVFAYREYQRLVRHWRELLPADRFFELSYEELVTDRENAIRKLLDFCGLPWAEECLHPERQTRRVLTASLYRVRQGLDTSRVQRWKRFEPWLGEFLELA